MNRTPRAAVWLRAGSRTANDTWGELTRFTFDERCRAH